MDLLPNPLLVAAHVAVEVPRRLGLPIDSAYAGVRIDRFLAEHFPFLARHAWQKRIRADRLFVNQKPTSCNYLLHTGDQLTHLMPPGSEPETADEVGLIYQDQWLLAAAKPTNMPMHEGGYYHQRTFVKFVRRQFGDQWSPVHRLDLDTSGLVLSTADPLTREFLASQFRRRTIKKTYLFLTAHHPQSDSWQVDHPLGPIDCHRYNRNWLNPEGKSASTRFELVRKVGNLYLIRAFPVTGRTLQIRIHASFSGVPILGDKLCHPDPDVFTSYKQFGHTNELNQLTGHFRACLHSESLQFVHPQDARLTLLQCHLAEDMQKLIEIHDNFENPVKGSDAK